MSNPSVARHWCVKERAIMAKKKDEDSFRTIATNRRVRHEYELLDRF